MQDNTAWKQLNLPNASTYIEFPLAFTGKNAKTGKANAFAGLLLSCQFVLALIHTMNKICGEPAKLTYEYICKRLRTSKEIVSAALKALREREIIEDVGRSKYKIKAYYGKRNYVEVDDYLFEREFFEEYEKKDGQRIEKVKSLPYSRILTVSFLKRGNENPKENGVFVSSQARIGKALNLPKSTAGDSVRELIAASFVKTEKPDDNDKRRRGCSLFKVNPEILAVKHPKKALEAETLTAETLHERLLADIEYVKLIERIELNVKAYGAALIRSRRVDGKTPEQERLEEETAALRIELEKYFKIHNVDRKLFPPGFFGCDVIEK